MKHELVTLSATGLLLLLSGCGNGDGAEPANTDSYLVEANQANNYSFTSTLTFPPIAVAPDTDISFDWSELSRDFLGHSLDPLTDIDTVNVLLWTLTQEELETKLNNDTLLQSDLEIPATLFTEKMRTSGALFEFTLNGNPVSEAQILPYVDADAYPPEENTYLAIAATGEDLGQGSRMIQAFKLDPGSVNTDVVISDESTALDWEVDLQSLEPTPVPAGTAAITLDWSSMETNGLGNDFESGHVTRVAIAHYVETPAELEEDFLTLVSYDGTVIADELWQADVPSGSSADLTKAVDEAGESFPGIDDSGTWMLALFCNPAKCRNPAPWYLTFLTPSE